MQLPSQWCCRKLPAGRIESVGGAFLELSLRHRHPSRCAVPCVCRACIRQLGLPFDSVNRQCRKLLDEQQEADASFLNFCLDSLVVKIMGVRSRDFQLDLCDETVAVLDQDLLVRAAYVDVSNAALALPKRTSARV